MKPVIIIFVITSLFAACNSKSSDSSNVVGVDTTGLYKNNTMADTSRLIAAPGTTAKKVVETRSPDGSVTTTTTTVSPDKSHRAAVAPVNTSAATTTTATTSQSTATVQKTGWSSKAKDATIGGLGGAAAGALIDKKKGQGAIIGGLAGAAGGYIIGNAKDKKTGR